MRIVQANAGIFPGLGLALFRRRSSVPAWLLLAALLFQVVGAALIERGTASSASGLGLTEICSVVHTLDDNFQPGSGQGPQGETVHCVFCLPLLQSNIVQNPSFALLGAVTPLPSAYPILANAGWSKPPRAWGAASPQAPPLS